MGGRRLDEDPAGNAASDGDLRSVHVKQDGATEGTPGRNGNCVSGMDAHLDQAPNDSVATLNGDDLRGLSGPELLESHDRIIMIKILIIKPSVRPSERTSIPCILGPIQ